MRSIERWIAPILVLCVITLLSACGSVPLAQEPTLTPAEERNAYTLAAEEPTYLQATVTPCVSLEGSRNDPCERRADVEIYVPYAYSVEVPQPPKTLEEQLSERSGRSAPHMVIRGTFAPDSTRCEPRPLHTPDYLEPPYSPGGVKIRLFNTFWCHTDVVVNEYMVGTGPAQLPVATMQLPLGSVPGVGATFRELADTNIESYESANRAIKKSFDGPVTTAYLNDEILPGIAGSYEGREWVIWLAPVRTLTVEGWDAYGLWDVQKREDGEIVAVGLMRPYYSQPTTEYLAILEPTLDDYRERIKKAHKKMLERNSGRIGIEEYFPKPLTDANTKFLRAHLVDEGAFDVDELRPKAPPPVPGEGSTYTPGARVDDSEPASTPAGPGG